MDNYKLHSMDSKDQIKPFTQIFESQLVQEEVGSCVFCYVPGAEFKEEDIDRMQAAVRNNLPSTMTIEFRRVERIPRTATGKFQHILSRVAHGRI